jgi:hypothetical protein
MDLPGSNPKPLIFLSASVIDGEIIIIGFDLSWK